MSSYLVAFMMPLNITIWVAPFLEILNFWRVLVSVFKFPWCLLVPELFLR